MLKNEKLLDQHSAEKPFTILLVGENLDDGIGDFIHLYDFYKHLKEKYKNDKRVKIECISFIDDKKLEIINRIHGTEFKITENSDESANDNDISFFRTKRSASESQALLEKTNKNKNCDLLFYLPVHPGELEVTPRSHIYLAEYESGNLHSPQPTDKISDNTWNFHRNMGIAPDRAGIKIIHPIIEAKKKFDDAKNEIPNYDNKYFELTKKEDTFLAAGYMQSKFQADIFIINCIALAGDKNTINMVTNTDGIIDTTNKELFYSKKLNDYVKNMNISRIEVVSPGGEILFDKNVENVESKKVLRIIQFKNISEHDKNLLFARADCVGASGDTSISELISSM